MKVRVALLIVSIASLLAALVCAQGITIQRGGSDWQRFARLLQRNALPFRRRPGARAVL
jgi:hypothetical protein